MKIYIAAPLFNEAERSFNAHIADILESCGHEVFLPQKAGGCVADLPDLIDGMEKRKYLFRLDCAHMDWCDTLLFLSAPIIRFPLVSLCHSVIQYAYLISGG